MHVGTVGFAAKRPRGKPATKRIHTAENLGICEAQFQFGHDLTLTRPAGLNLRQGHNARYIGVISWK